MIQWVRMEPEPTFAEIRAILHDVAEQQKLAALRMDRAEARMDRADARATRAEARMDRAEVRMDRADARMKRAEARLDRMDETWNKRFEATRALVQGGIKFVQRRDAIRDAKLAALIQTVDKLTKSQQALIVSFRRGGNGNGWRRA